MSQLWLVWAWWVSLHGGPLVPEITWNLAIFSFASLHSKIERHCIFLLQITSRIDWKWNWGPGSHFFIHILIAKGTKKRDAPSAARKGGRRMSSCNTKSGIRTETKQDKPTRTSAKTKGVSCSCGHILQELQRPITPPNKGQMSSLTK